MILMYHHLAPREAISKNPPPDEAWGLNHTPHAFKEQVLALRRRGWRFQSLVETVAEIRRTGREPRRTVEITFDDGWIDQYEYGMPMLKELGVTATFFVTTEHLRMGSRDPKRMGREQLLRLREAGMTVGGHTRTHRDLIKLSATEAREEIGGCKADLEAVLGDSIGLFAYPGGSFNAEVANLARECGFDAACSALGPARNDRSTLYWLHRDLLSEGTDSLRDRYRLSPLARWMFAFRVKHRLRRQLRRQVSAARRHGPSESYDPDAIGLSGLPVLQHLDRRRCLP